MDELDDIALEISDSEDQSIGVVGPCPTPPEAFRRRVSNESITIILPPPTDFNDVPAINLPEKNFVNYDDISFDEAKVDLLATTATEPVSMNGTRLIPPKKRPNLFSRLVNLVRNRAQSTETVEFNRQCDQLLTLCRHSCQLNNPMHLRILCTIYRRLTDSREIAYCTTGPHWERIGFQGVNPETDFRSTGLFSILCLIYFVDVKRLNLAKEVYRFSLDEQQNFPFCCIGINLSNIVIRTLRQSKHRMNIRKIINEKQMSSSSDRFTVELIGNLFTVLFFNFYSKWKQNGYTIENTQQALHDLEQLLNNRPQSLFDELNNYYRNNETRSTMINENLI